MKAFGTAEKQIELSDLYFEDTMSYLIFLFQKYLEKKGYSKATILSYVRCVSLITRRGLLSEDDIREAYKHYSACTRSKLLTVWKRYNEFLEEIGWKKK